MEQQRNGRHRGLIINSLIFIASVLVGICPLVYLSFCHSVNISPNQSLESMFGVVAEVAVICLGGVSLIAWVVGAWQEKPERTLDALRSIIIGCLVAFLFLASYYFRK